MRHNAQIKLTQKKLKEAGIFRKKRDIAKGGLVLSNLVFDFADLAGVYLPGADFEKTKMAGVTLSGSNLSRAKFTGTTFDGVNMGCCNLLGTRFTDVDLTEVSLSSYHLFNLVLTNVVGLMVLDTTSVKAVAHYSGRADFDPVTITLRGVRIAPHQVCLTVLDFALGKDGRYTDYYKCNFDLSEKEKNILVAWCSIVKLSFKNLQEKQDEV